MQSTVVRKSVQPTPAPRTFPLRRMLRLTAPFITFAIIISVWQVVAALEIYPSFLLPPPADVIEKFYEVTIGGGRVSLWVHLWATLQAVLGGLLTGLIAAVVLGYMIAKIPLLEDFLSPIVVAFQATPVVAYAPLLVIWFGSGIESKVITSALIVFFPTLMNTIVGVRSVPKSLTDLMRSLNATPRQMMLKLEIPAAAPVLIGGLKVSATLAVIGAVVGEFVSAKAGLGFLINIGRNQYDMPLVIVAVLTLTLMALVLYGLVVLLEHFALAWRKRARL
ncbi:MAG: ABC transporter permease [Chloroflexota bacterium]